jgi:hypothetical protein
VHTPIDVCADCKVLLVCTETVLSQQQQQQQRMSSDGSDGSSSSSSVDLLFVHVQQDEDQFKFFR